VCDERLDNVDQRNSRKYNERKIPGIVKGDSKSSYAFNNGLDAFTKGRGYGQL
jgi:hypothetical protein